MNLIEVKNLSFSYDQYKYVLQNINMSFQKGKIYGIFGRSGAGKSTLLSLISGLELPKEETVFYKGKDLSKMDRNHYRCHDIGIIFQSYNLLPHLTGLENVILSMDINGMKKSNQEKKEIALTLLKKVGIDAVKANRPVLKLSGGEQQRVSIARALAKEPEIMFCDEPTGALDEKTGKVVLETLIEANEKFNTTMLIITHNPGIAAIGDRVIRMNSGCIVEDVKNKKRTKPSDISWG